MKSSRVQVASSSRIRAHGSVAAAVLGLAAAWVVDGVDAAGIDAVGVDAAGATGAAGTAATCFCGSRSGAVFFAGRGAGFAGSGVICTGSGDANALSAAPFPSAGARTFASCPGGRAAMLSAGATGGGIGDLADSGVRAGPASACLSASGERFCLPPLVADGSADMTLESSPRGVAALTKASGANMRQAKNVAAAAKKQAITIEKASPVRFGADA